MPGVASFAEELCVGRFRWDLIHPFPTQGSRDRLLGDAAVKELTAFLTEQVDPTVIDSTGELPGDVVDGLRERGYLNLVAGPELGGLGLSRFNTFRMVEAAASWSMAVGFLLATQNGIGAGPFADALPPGSLREFVRAGVAAGAVSGLADTEAYGQANTRRHTTATPTEDGAAYLLNGEKIHISNAPVAGLLAVTATIAEEDGQTRMFFVDTRAPGCHVESGHEFMGVKGFPNGRVVLRDVRVPRELMLVEEAAGRHTPELTFLLTRGRLQLVVAPSVAIAKQCLRWSREFALRRHIDGRALGEYEAIQRSIADSLADLFALQSVAEWALLGDDEPVNPLLEQLAAKNATSIACGRVVERTMSMFAAEGFETASSKARRGAPPVPLERAFRDARGLRIWGGVDFLLDIWFSRLETFTYYYPEPENAAEIESEPAPPEDVAGLSARNRDHVRFVAEQARAFARTCLRLSRRYPDPERLYTRQWILILAGRIIGELLTMSLVLSRAASLAVEQNHDVQDVADVYCCAAGHRLAGWWRRLTSADDPADEPDHAGVAAGWLRGEGSDLFTADVVPDLPQVAAR